MYKIIISIVVWFFLVSSVFAELSDTQKTIRDNFSSIENKVIPDDVIDDYNQNAKAAWSPDLQPGATYGQHRVLIEDGIDGPVTRSALGDIASAQAASASSSTSSTSSTSSSSSSSWSGNEPCKFDVDNENRAIWAALDDCLRGSSLVDADGDIQIETWAKAQILTWTTAIAQLLWLLAVGAIVYGGLLMTLSWGEDEKIKKWKDVVKWAIIGFLGVIFAGVLVRIVVELMFTIASVAS